MTVDPKLIGPKGEPGEQGLAGPPPPWWQLLLVQLPAILTGIAALLAAWGAYSASKGNAAKLAEHGEVLQKAAQDIEKTTVDMGTVSKTVKGIEEEKKTTPLQISNPPPPVPQEPTLTPEPVKPTVTFKPKVD